jgi:NAD(P)-dependent dehydrogenase (short-subunit alcohol dehydrogenase family)
MKIIIIGATGVIGSKVTASLGKDHQVIRAGSKTGDVHLDITSPASIENFFKGVGSFDALISTTGNGHFGPLPAMTDKDFRVGVDSKLLGQINLVLIGQHYVNPKGSFTLTSGILSEDFVAGGANLSAVNGAINSFVQAAAIELEKGVRINAVSPGVVEDSPKYFPFFPGHIPVAMNKVVNAYHKSAFGAITGRVIKVY